MKMAICKICAERYFMNMAFSFTDCLAGYRAETMVMAIAAVAYRGGTANDFMNMFLFFTLR